MAKISVIIPVYNYGKYLKEAVESVLSQQYTDYEIIIVNDGSTDNTTEVVKEFENHPRIKLITHQENLGLAPSCHEAIEASASDYIVRLDADDYFDENALLILANILDSNPEAGLVYPDYFLISEEGKLLDYVRLPKSGKEVKLLDLPANGAGTLFRRSCYEAVGGYDLSLRVEDNYDLWLKFLDRFKVCNVNLPLFYYRRHGSNMTLDSEKILEARRYIKQSFLDRELNRPKPKVLGIIPARAHDYCDYLAIRELGGKPLIAYSIEEALKTELLDKVVFTTEDKSVAEVARNYGVDVIMRPAEMAKGYVEKSALYVMDKLKKMDYHPEIVVVLHINSPFKKAENITEAINTIMIYDVDSVISVCEDRKFHYQRDIHGLRPLFEKRLLRLEKEDLYEENGAIYVSKKEVITEENFLGKSIGHILMPEEVSTRINNEYDFWLAEQAVKKRKGGSK
ncbi:glycosyltransferase [Chloroflexota bacterium]